MSVQASRAAQVRTGVRIEIFPVIWMVVEAAVSISALLIAFGLDSVVELVSGAILLWRLLVEARGKIQSTLNEQSTVPTGSCLWPLACCVSIFSVLLTTVC